MNHDINITNRIVAVKLHSDQPSNQKQDEPAFFIEAAERLDRISEWLRKLAKTTK